MEKEAKEDKTCSWCCSLSLKKIVLTVAHEVRMFAQVKEIQCCGRFLVRSTPHLKIGMIIFGEFLKWKLSF